MPNPTPEEIADKMLANIAVWPKPDLTPGRISRARFVDGRLTWEEIPPEEFFATDILKEQSNG